MAKKGAERGDVSPLFRRRQSAFCAEVLKGRWASAFLGSFTAGQKTGDNFMLVSDYFANVIRAQGENFEPKQFSTWAPKAIAMIGRMPSMLYSRSIRIELQRKRLTRRLSPCVLIALLISNHCSARPQDGPQTMGGIEGE